MKFEVSNVVDLSLINSDTNEIIFTGKTINIIENQHIMKQGKIIEENITVCALKIEDGLKVKIREKILNDIKRDTYIQENYDINIKRLNRWWYSVYFKKKKINEHITRTIDYI